MEKRDDRWEEDEADNGGYDCHDYFRGSFFSRPSSERGEDVEGGGDGLNCEHH